MLTPDDLGEITTALQHRVWHLCAKCSEYEQKGYVARLAQCAARYEAAVNALVKINIVRS